MLSLLPKYEILKKVQQKEIMYGKKCCDLEHSKHLEMYSINMCDPFSTKAYITVNRNSKAMQTKRNEIQSFN